MAAEQQHAEDTPAPPPPRRGEAGVGALLKASRLRVGEDLRDIAQILRIRYVYMEAIEDGRYEALPGPTYAAGFIRAYAEHLGLDSEEVVRRFKAEGSGARVAADLVFPEPIPEPGIPGGAVILVGIVVAVVAYGVWYMNTSKDGFLAELVSPLPDRLSNLVEGEGRPPAASAGGTTAATPEPTPEPQPTAAPEPATEAAPEPAQAAPEASPRRAPAPATPSPQPQDEPTAASAPEPAPEPAQAAPEASPRRAPEPATAATPEPTPAPAPEPVAATPVADTAATTAPEPVRQAPGSATSAETTAETPPTPAVGAAPATVPESRETPVATARPPAPVEPIEPVIAPGNVPVDMIPPARPATSAATAAATTPAATAAPAAPPEPTATPSATEAATTAGAAPSVAATATGEAGSRIVVRAKVNSWIQVRDEAAGELLVTRLLRSGDSYAVPNRDGLRLSTGNAGALEILVDGETVPAIGDEGAVRRNVLLDAEKLKAGQAVTE